MLSPKIDLTEHRDFGGTRFAFTGFHPLVERWFDDGNISMDEYDYMCWFEGIFGKFRHKNEKNKVFDKEGAYEKELRTHCHRCGKPLRIPWKIFYDLCEECNEIMDSDYRRIPWKSTNKEISHNIERNDLFNLR